MIKNTIKGGSLLAKLFPTFAKSFLETASQDEVTKAEQEAAIIHQQLNDLGESKPESSTTPLEAAVPAVLIQTAHSAPAGTAVDVVALTKRATDAEAKATDLQGKLTAAEKDRDQYKGWYDKQVGVGTQLPGADASTRTQTQDDRDKMLSQADQHALSLIRGR